MIDVIDLAKITNDAEMTKILTFVVLVGISVFFSFLLSAMYIYFTNRRYIGEKNLYKLFPLIALALTSIFCTLQFSIPLSLGLLGSLSIVRFRTPIKDPLEIGFILVIIAISLLSASNNIGPVVIVTTLTFVILFLWRRNVLGFSFDENKVGSLVISYPIDDYRRNEKEILSILGSSKVPGKISNINEVDQHCSVLFNFGPLSMSDIADLKRKLDFNARFSLYFEKAGDIEFEEKD